MKSKQLPDECKDPGVEGTVEAVVEGVAGTGLPSGERNPERDRSSGLNAHGGELAGDGPGEWRVGVVCL